MRPDPKRWRLACTVFALASLGPTAGSAAEPDDLTRTISAMDEAAFDAFNRCGDPAQLSKHSAFFDVNVEFYHDNGGVTWNRDTMLANTAKYACGKYRRELVAGTLKVFPIKDFGAIAQGTHQFCGLPVGPCEGRAEFTTIWRLKDNAWQMTRVLSYGHRAN